MRALEEQRFALDQQKWEFDAKVRLREIELKEKESGLTSKLFSPLTATLLAGVLTLAGSVAGTLLQGQQNLKLEQTKFETTRNLDREKFESETRIETQKQEHELVLRMIGVAETDQARKNLKFLADSGLLSEERSQKILKAANETEPRIPPIQHPERSFKTPSGDWIACSFDEQLGSYNCRKTNDPIDVDTSKKAK